MMAAVTLWLLSRGAASDTTAGSQTACIYEHSVGRYRESGCLTPGVEYCGTDPLPTNGNIECFPETPLADVVAKCNSHTDCVGFSYHRTAHTGCLKNNYLFEWCDEPGAPAPCGGGVYDGYDKGRYADQPYVARKAQGQFKLTCACGPCPAWGRAFLAVVLGAAAAYVAGGVAWNVQKAPDGAVRLRSTRGVASLLPHRRFWTEVAGMVHDG